MSIQMPETPEEMMRLPGVTKANFEKYGQKLLNLTVKYSAEKFCILSEHDDKIEEFNTQQAKATASKARSASKSAPKSRMPDVNSEGWIDMESIDSIKSRYTSKPTTAVRKKKVTRRKRKSTPRKKSPKKRGTTSVLTNLRKSLSKTNVFRYSPKSKIGSKPATTTSRAATTSKPSSSSGFGGGAGLGMMPMPKPVQRKLNL
jgi:hypothetical protein